MILPEASSSSRRAAFIDRDGVINEEKGFVYRVEDFVLLPGTIDALRQLQSAGYLLVIITNQSGIARGLYSEAAFLQLTKHMQQFLVAEGVKIDSIEYCPHLPDAAIAQYRLDCNCRKPRPGMIERARDALNVDVTASILVGDRSSDVEAGRRAGVGRCFLVRTGYGPDCDGTEFADRVYDDLAACVRDLLPESRR